MHADTQLIFEEREYECEYAMDFTALATDVLDAGDAEWAQRIFATAVRRARSTEDKSWLLVDGLENGLCSADLKHRLISFFEARVRPQDRLTSLDTFLRLDDKTRAAKCCRRWATRARSVEFLTDVADKALEHRLADADEIMTWVKRAELNAKTDDDWYLVTQAWSRLKNGDAAVRAAEEYERRTGDIDDLLTTIGLLKSVAASAAADRCWRILKESHDPLTMAFMMGACVDVCPEIVPQAIRRFLELPGNSHDCLMVLRDTKGYSNDSQVLTLLDRAKKRAEDIYEVCLTIEVALEFEQLDFAQAMFESQLESAPTVTDELALMKTVVDSGYEPLIVHASAPSLDAAHRVKSVEDILDCAGLLRHFGHHGAFDQLLNRAERIVRGGWAWMDMLTALSPKAMVKDAERARNWVQRAQYTTLTPIALSALADYVVRHFGDEIWAAEIEANAGVCKRGVQHLRRLCARLGQQDDALDCAPSPGRWNGPEAHAIESDRLSGLTEDNHRESFYQLMRCDEEYVSAVMAWASRNGVFPAQDFKRVHAEIKRTITFLSKLYFELEQMAISMGDFRAMNGCLNAQLTAAFQRGQIDESIVHFIHAMVPPRTRLWAGD
ncbi:MAG: hypothetical protein VX589_11750 [Myxococcota bacterium]|nr:hypothetical protein [Myxococcota bacterium]